MDSEEQYPMKSGDGPCCYSNNSHLQRHSADIWKTKMIKAIEENLEIDDHDLCPTFKIADLGCSVGPNTFISVKNIVEAIDRIFHLQNPSSKLIDFQVFFNDHVSNDFNALFCNLPPDRNYFAAAVAGSFHGRLFPKASLNVVHSSFSVQWLSKAPKELRDLASPACNRGKIFYDNSPDEVWQAYSAQFAVDMERFLAARAYELTAGGLMMIILPARQKGKLPGECSMGPLFRPLEDSLIDLVNEGKISKDQLDSFNLPQYSPSEEELRTLVKKNGFFEVVSVETTNPMSLPVLSAEASRASLESVLSKHFGNDIIDPLYQRYSQMIDGLPHLSFGADIINPLYQRYSQTIDGLPPLTSGVDNVVGCFAFLKRNHRKI